MKKILRTTRIDRITTAGAAMPLDNWRYLFPKYLATNRAAFLAPIIDCSIAEAAASMALTEIKAPSESKTNEGNDA